MKKLIIPTDFSVSSEKSIDYGVEIARVTGASLYLVNVYQIPVSMGDMPVMMVSAEELKKNSDTALKDLKHQVLQKHPQVIIETESRMGDVVDEINDICNNDSNVLALLVGTKPYKGLEKILFGNTTMALVRNCTTPVISVPANAKIQSPANVALATDLANTDQIPVNKINEIIQALKASLHVVHIKDKNTPSANDAEELLNNLTPSSPLFKTVEDEDVIHGLQQYAEEHKIDLLIALPHKHNWYERMFFKLHTEGLIEKLPIPVLCFQNQ